MDLNGHESNSSNEYLPESSYSSDSPSTPPFNHSRSKETLPAETMSPASGISCEFEAYLGIHNSKFGRFEILRRLGSGGHGVVFLAYDSILSRFIALKVPKPEVLFDPSMRRRFLAEGMTAAVLMHPNIVTVFESNEVGSICYLAQDYVPGPSLSSWLKAHPGPVAPRIASAFILQLAEALSHAHDHGILHRDIKPGNILLAPNDLANSLEGLSRYSPKLADFGIAKIIEGNNDNTHSGSILGTPAYMPPEQALGRNSELCWASDIYSLGAVFYELLVGKPAYRGENGLKLLHEIARHEPESTRKSNPAIPRDLDAVCMKCLSHELSDRYANAHAFVDDLRHFLEGRPVSARPQTILSAASRWSRRNPVTALLTAVTALSLVIMLIGSLWYNARLNESLLLVQQHAQDLNLRTEALRRRVYADDLIQAAEAWHDGNVGEAHCRLLECNPKHGETDLRSFPYWMLSHAIQNSSHIIDTISRGALAAPLAVNADSQTFLCGEADGVVRIRSLPDGHLQHELQGHTSAAVNSLNLSTGAEHSLAVVADNDGAVSLWNLKTRTEVLSVNAHQGATMTACFLDEKAARFASGGEDGVIRIWNAITGNQVSELAGHTDTIRALAVQRELNILFSSSEDGTVRAWDLNHDGRPLVELSNGQFPVPRDAGWARTLAISPNGSILAAGFRSGLLVQWDINDNSAHFGQILDDRGFNSGIRSIDWIDDENLVTGFADSRLIVGRSFNESHSFNDVFAGHHDWILSLAAIPNRSGVLSSSKDGTIRYWPEKELQGTIRIPSQYKTLKSAPSWTQTTVAFCKEHELFAYRTPEMTEQFRLDIRQMPEGVWSTLSADASHFLTTFKEEHDTALVSLNCATGARNWQVSLGNRLADCGTSSADGNLILAGVSHEILILDGKTGKCKITCAHPSPVTQVEFVPLTTTFVSSSMDGRIRIWDATTGEILREWIGHQNSIQRIAISQDGTVLVTSGEDMVVRVWRISDGKEIASFAVDAELEGLHLVDEGRTLITVGNQQLRFWSIADRNEVMRWKRLPNTSVVQLSPDRKTLAVHFCNNVRLYRGSP